MLHPRDELLTLLTTERMSENNSGILTCGREYCFMTTIGLPDKNVNMDAKVTGPLYQPTVS